MCARETCVTCDAPVLSVLLKAAVAWDVIEQVPCAINLVRVPKSSTGFHDFEALKHSWQPHTRTSRRTW